MIVSITALGIVASYGWMSTNKVTAQECPPEKEISGEPARETALKRASLQLWENIVRL
jgi:hypothetical protein